MKTKLVFTVGNELMGDDAAGPLLARRLEESPLAAWDVLDGGNAPENYVYKVRELAPEQVVIVDSADMGLPAGEVRHIRQDSIGSLFLMTTHSLPLSFLMDAIRDFVPAVELIGIQPQTVAFGYPVSSEVSQAVDQVFKWLEGGTDATGSIKPM
jgi:hydrogenase 3 maturation protease